MAATLVGFALRHAFPTPSAMSILTNCGTAGTLLADSRGRPRLQCLREAGDDGTGGFLYIDALRVDDAHLPTRGDYTWVVASAVRALLTHPRVRANVDAGRVFEPTDDFACATVAEDAALVRFARANAAGS